MTEEEYNAKKLPALVLENKSRRQLEAEKKSARDQAAQKAVEEAKEKIIAGVKQVVLKAVKSAFAASIVAAIVTWVLWLGQAILGNWLSSKIIPKLGLGEGILFAISTILVILVVVGVFSLAALIVELIVNPGFLLDIVL